MNDNSFFTSDEVAMLRFTAICQQSCDPEMYGAYLALCQQLIDTRPGLRAGCFARIEDYLCGKIVPAA